MYFRNLDEKNISKLNVNNTNYSDIEDDLISIFYSLDTEELLDLIPINRYLVGEAVWITPNGAVLRSDVHSNISSDLFYYMCEHELSNIDEYTADDFALQDEFDFCDHLTDELNWIKFNTGNGFYDERCYVVLPYKITSKQYNVLEELISQTMTNSDGLLVLTDKPSVKQIYPYNIYSENDIIKKIKRYTINGILEEGIFLESKEDQKRYKFRFKRSV